jgi:hypothetical protein
MAVGEGKPICEICGRTFKNYAGLNGHKRWKHETGGGETKEVITHEGLTPEEIKADPELQKEKYSIYSYKTIKMGGDLLYLAEQLVNAGLASNLADLMRKALITYGGINNIKYLTKGDTMDKETLEILRGNDNPLSAAMAYKILSDSSNNSNNNGSDMINILLLTQLMNKQEKAQSNSDNLLPVIMMMNQNKHESNNNNELIATLLLAAMNKPQEKSIDPATLIALAQNKSGIEAKDLINLMGNMTKDKDNVSQILVALEKIRADRDKEIAKSKEEVQRIRDEAIRKEIMELRNMVSNEDSTLGKKLRSKLDKMMEGKFEEAIKNASGEKSGIDTAKDVIMDAIDKIKEPLLDPLGKAVAENIRSQQNQQYPVQQVTQEPSPQFQQTEVQNPEPQNEIVVEDNSSTNNEED